MSCYVFVAYFPVCRILMTKHSCVRALQVAVYGFNDRVGQLSFPPKDQELNKPYSPETARIIDEEVKKLVDEQYKRCRELLTEKKDFVVKLAEALLEKEVSPKGFLQSPGCKSLTVGLPQRS